MKPLDAVVPASLAVVDTKVCAPYALPADAPEASGAAPSANGSPPTHSR